MNAFSRSLFCGFLAILCACPLFGQAGASGMTFLKLGVGARSLAMGEAATASSADIAGTYYNPASLAEATSADIAIMHKEWFQDVKTDYVGARVEFSKLSFGLGVNATSVNGIQIREIPGPPEATFDAHNVALGLTSAYRFDTSVSFGLSVKYLYEKILVNEASGWGLDVGVLYKTPWNLRVGFSASNFGSMASLDNESSTLPLVYRFGALYTVPAQSLSGSLAFAGDYVRFSQDGINHLHLGAEYSYGSSVAFRLGYQTGYESRSFTTGLGIHYGFVQVDYAFLPMKDDLGSTHTVSLGIQFH